MAQLSTNVPQITFGPTGFVAPSDADILAGVQADINAAFGGNLNQSLSTPQGQLATSLAAMISNCFQAFIALANQFNPAYAEGSFQDAIGEFYFIEREPSEATVVSATCIGAAGTPIPVGALAIAEDGNIYSCTNGGMIPAGGSIDLEFSCTVLGPIACPAGTLNQIYKTIPGWDTISNPDDGVIGTNVESRSQFETRREQSVAGNATNCNEAVMGAVLAIDGVLDAYVVDNPANTPATIGGFSLAAHSIYVAAVGGADADVAQAIWTKKPPGCNMNGNTTVTVTGSSSLYVPPLPTWDITFERPPGLPVLFAVKLINNAQIPSDAVTRIQNAIINAFAGGDGGTRARIGSTILAVRFVAPIVALGSWAQIQFIQIGSSNTPAATFTGSIAGTALTVSAIASGTIATGQTISDLDGEILPGTTIVSGSGTSWQVSTSQTIDSTQMCGSLANQNDVVVDIDQVPTINANNIQVTTT